MEQDLDDSNATVAHLKETLKARQARFKELQQEYSQPKLYSQLSVVKAFIHNSMMTYTAFVGGRLLLYDLQSSFRGCLLLRDLQSSFGGCLDRDLGSLYDA